MLGNYGSETISAGGTGNLTLSGAVDVAHTQLITTVGLNNHFWYSAEDGSNREIGVGHLSAATTLVRDQVHETLNGGTLNRASPSALDLSTDSKISIVAAAQTMLTPHPGNFYPAGGIQGMCTMGNSDEARADHYLYHDDLAFFPFWWACSKMVSEISVICRTAVAGCDARFGVYSIAESGKPGFLLKEFTVDTQMSLDTTGIKTIVAATPFWMPSGFYYIAAIASTGNAYIAAPQNYAVPGLFMGIDSAGNSLLSVMINTIYGPLPSDVRVSTFVNHVASPTFWLN